MLLNKTALPYTHTGHTNRLTPGSLHQPCPSRYRLVFGTSTRVFLNSVTPCACFGREKGVCDKLQRHPLIDPMFRPHPSPKRKGEVLSAPFARGNLHLVIPFIGTQPLNLRYSNVKSYNNCGDCTRRAVLRQVQNGWLNFRWILDQIRHLYLSRLSCRPSTPFKIMSMLLTRES